MTDASSVYALAVELLTASQQIIAATPGGPLTNAYISHGPPAYDCPDMLTVHVGVLQYAPQIRRQAPTAPPQPDPKMPVVLVVPLTITALRCAHAVPDGSLELALPTGDATASDAEKVYADGWSLMNGIRKKILNGSLFPGHPCRIWDFDNVTPVAPEGGALGWMMNLYVALDGFDPVGA